MADARYAFELFVVDDPPRAQQLAARVIAALDRVAAGQYEFTITNVLADPDRAVAARVFATPMLIRTHPLPALRVLGDLSDPVRVIKLLGIEAPA